MLEVRLLGHFDVQLDSTPVKLASRPAQLLFAYLALHPGTAHRREWLAGLFWPESTESNARRNLRQAIWQIRHTFEAGAAWFASNNLTIAFNPPAAFRLDAALFNGSPAAAAGAAGIAAITETTPVEPLVAAASAYRGELLPGFYEDWVLLEREQVQARFEQVMSLLLGRLIEARRWNDVLQWGEHWIALGHTPEAAYRALMTAHAALEDISQAADTYRRCVEALRRDMDVEPSEQTRALYERISRGVATIAAETSPRAPAQPLNNLPVHLTSFIGRERELSEIRRLLIPTQATDVPDVAVRLLTLTEVGGTGKTRLALQAAADMLGQFADGVWLVELATLSDSNLIPQSVAAVLGVREEPNHPLIQTLADTLRMKSLLLILDNCEHLIDACAQFVAALLRACPRLKVIATSRETLGMPGETVMRVPSLMLPDAGRLPPLADLARCESIRLFVERATAIRPGLRLNDANAPAVAQICQRLDGVPLAIELAAARVHAMTVEQIAVRLDDRFRLLTGGSRTALPRQQTLRATIDWSWDLLSDGERTLLRRLSVFVDGWTLEAAENIAAGDATSDPEVLDLLSRLVEKSLVIAEQYDTETRYSLLDTIRQYARDKLLESGEAERVRARHVHYYLRLSDEVEPRLRAADQMIWLARLEVEHGNMRAALQWALGDATSGNDSEASLRLAGNLTRFWYLRGYWKEGRHWLELALAQPVAETPMPESLARARARALCGAGWLADDDGSEVAFYTESLALYRQIGDTWGQAFSLRGLVSGVSFWDKSSYVRACLQESLALSRQLQEPWCTALALYSLGWMELYDTGVERAESTWQEALDLFRRSGDRWGIAVTLGSLGYVARTKGQYPQAAGLMKQSLTLFRELGDKAGIGISLTRLGNVALRRSDYDEAAALLEESLALNHERGDWSAIVHCMSLLGLVACYQGDATRALARFEEGLGLARALNNRDALGYLSIYMAFALYRHLEIARAEAIWRDALSSFSQIDDKDGIAFVLYGLGMVSLMQGDDRLAAERLTQSLDMYRVIGDRRYIAIVLNGLGKLAQTRNDPAGAITNFKESLSLCRHMGDKLGMIEAVEGIATAMDITNGSAKHRAGYGAISRATKMAQLLGAAQTLRNTIGAPLPLVECDGLERRVNALRASLGDAAFMAAWEEGGAMTLEQAVTTANEAIDQ